MTDGNHEYFISQLENLQQQIQTEQWISRERLQRAQNQINLLQDMNQRSTSRNAQLTIINGALTNRIEQLVREGQLLRLHIIRLEHQIRSNTQPTASTSQNTQQTIDRGHRGSLDQPD